MLLKRKILKSLLLVSIILGSLNAFGENPKLKALDERCMRLEEQIASQQKENNSLKANIRNINDVLKMHDNNINSIYDETQRLNKKGYKLLEIQK